MDKIAYLKGLLDGQEVDKSTKEGKAFYAVCDALEELLKYTQELEDRVTELEELCDILDEDLGEMEDLLVDDDDDYEFDELDDDFGDEQYETVCPTCGKCILLDEATLEEGETVCPNCGEELEFDFDEREIAELAPSDSTED
ncbi:MAG: hypothetical protein K5695_18410 [Oscillospiraceae bacterium]|nr:hypothetical protein [Oscillospiraceae bacterium]